MKVFIVYMNDCSFCLSQLIAQLRERGVAVTARERTNLSRREMAKHDLIMVLAGDGTFLKAAHLVNDIPMVGINATPGRRVGFFCRTTPKTIMGVFEKWRAGKLRPKKLMRLEATITHHGRRIAPFLCLNEIFVGCQRPFHVSRYWLHVNGKKEYQKSSGVIVAAPAGSTAWARTAGGRKLPLTARALQFVTREPVQSRIVRMKMLKGVLPARSTVKIVSDMDDGIIAIDSYPEPWNFARGESITIRASKKPLLFLA